MRCTNNAAGTLPAYRKAVSQWPARVTYELRRCLAAVTHRLERGAGCRAWCIVVMGGGLAFFASSDVPAHPHAYIDVEMQVRFDASARIAALRQTWLFDGLYSAYVTQGLALKEKDKRDTKQLEAIAQVMMNNLSRFHYLTRVDSGTHEIEFGPPVEATASFKGTRLEVVFTLPLATPVAAVSEPFTYSVYDPTYYIEMLHAEQTGAIQLVNAPAECGYVLQHPHPDPTQVAKAAALDRTQSAGTGLGEFFAERVTIRCGAQH